MGVSCEGAAKSSLTGVGAAGAGCVKLWTIGCCVDVVSAAALSVGESAPKLWLSGSWVGVGEVELDGAG